MWPVVLKSLGTPNDDMVVYKAMLYLEGPFTGNDRKDRIADVQVAAILRGQLGNNVLSFV